MTSSHPRSLIFAAFLLTLASRAAAQPEIRLEPVADGLDDPVALTHAGDGTGRLFVTLQDGQIVIIDGGRVLPRPFLDIRGPVLSGGERGLLSTAFHPNYPVNGFFYVFYTDSSGDLTIARYRVSSNPDVADPGSATVLLSVRHRNFGNHNGGQLQFGPDGYLYIATGDGGGAGDPGNNGQDVGELLGKILRIDVDSVSGSRPYDIPPNNPLLGNPDARGEIWAYGLRNAWRFSFDRSLGDLWIADVGQNRLEEINLERAPSAGGRNYGWRRMEASSCFNPSSGCNDGSLVLPVLEYSHDEGCSVTGGYRYRGREIADLEGVYVFGDFCSGTVWGALERNDGSFRREELLRTGLSITAFGEDENGELYVVSTADDEPSIQKIVGEPAGEAVLETRPSSLNFAQVRVGSSKTKRLRVINTGASPAQLETLRLAGGGREAFEILGGDGCSGTTLAPGARCSVRLRFTPPAVGVFRAEVVIPFAGGELRTDLRGRGR